MLLWILDMCVPPLLDMCRAIKRRWLIWRYSEYCFKHSQYKADEWYGDQLVENVCQWCESDERTAARWKAEHDRVKRENRITLASRWLDEWGTR